MKASEMASEIAAAVRLSMALVDRWEKDVSELRATIEALETSLSDMQRWRDEAERERNNALAELKRLQQGR